MTYNKKMLLLLVLDTLFSVLLGIALGDTLEKARQFQEDYLVSMSEYPDDWEPDEHAEQELYETNLNNALSTYSHFYKWQQEASDARN